MADNPTILIIDDSESLRLLIRDALGLSGAHLVDAEDGEAGLEQIRSLKPDLVLLDYYMPKMTGLDVLHQVRSDADEVIRETRVIVVTSDARPETIQQLAQLNVHAYVVKPFTAENLNSRVVELLRSAA